jgi:preprotein translocase subunit SecA
MNQPGECPPLDSLVRRVKDLGPGMTRMTDAELRKLRYVLGDRLAEGQAVEVVTAEAFAVVAEVVRRTTGRFYSDVDIMAGIALYSGQAVQSDDDGYNHVVALLPAYLCALLRQHVHYVTTTAALARRSYQEAVGLCAALGLASRLLPGTTVSRETAGRAPDVDVTYGSYQKMALEYLGEHLAPDAGLAERKHQRAIIDQIDSVLIDHANLSLFITAPKPPNAEFFLKVAVAAAALKLGRHYEIDAATGAVSLRGEGLAQGAALLGIGTLEGLEAAMSRRYLEDALRAKDWYRRGKDYQLAGAGVAVSREPSGRLEGGRRLRAGILQAIEAKEGLAASPEVAVWARITVSDYFRTYVRLCGISGVAAHSASEMERVYGLTTAVIPSPETLARVDHAELMFEGSRARFEALAADAEIRHRRGEPIVIGVLTEADSMLVGRMLTERHIAFRALGPGDEETACHTLAQAGRTGSVTVLTAEVARGCDVPLGRPATSEPGREPPVVGLAVLAAGRSRSRRWDQWLRGLAGRRGEPGESRFFLSLEDPLLRGLQSRVWNAMPPRIRRKADGTPLGGAQLRVVDHIQRQAEEADARQRREQLAVAEVEGAQRSQVYSLIEELARKSDLVGYISELIDEVAAIYVRRYSDPDRLLSALSMLYPCRLTIDDLAMPGADPSNGGPLARREERIRTDARKAYSQHWQLMDPPAMRETERRVVYSVLARSWSQHLGELEAMRAMANVDGDSPDRLADYNNEAATRFTAMLENAKEDIVGYLFHSEAGARG